VELIRPERALTLIQMQLDLNDQTRRHMERTGDEVHKGLQKSGIAMPMPMVPHLTEIQRVVPAKNPLPIGPHCFLLRRKLDHLPRLPRRHRPVLSGE
jgi:hypothetical protein